MLGNVLHRYLDPSDSLGELLFGLIMALTLTLGARLLLQRSEIDNHEIAAGMLGCNIAWGLIDGALYLLGSVFNRNRRQLFVRRLKAAQDDVQAMRLVREEFGLEDEPIAAEEDRAALQRLVLQVMKRADPRRRGVGRVDAQGAAAIAVLVSLTAVPGVLALLLIEDGFTALRVANFVQVGLLFWVGHRWASHTGANPWLTGLAIATLGFLLVLIAIPLGG